MVLPTDKRTPRSLGMSPVGTRHIGPPGDIITKIDTMIWLGKYKRSRREQFWRCSGIVLRLGRTLCNSSIACCCDKMREIFIRDRVLIHPEAVNDDGVCRCLFRVTRICTHQKRVARYPDHTRMRWITSQLRLCFLLQHFYLSQNTMCWVGRGELIRVV